MAPSSTTLVLVLVLALAVFQPSMVSSGDAGIIYGRNGDNLPSPKQVINFLTNDMKYKISLLRIYDANLEILEALSRTNLVVTIGVPNEAISYVASRPAAADKWVEDHIITYIKKGVRFRYICVGNEAIPGVVAAHVLQAIVNLQNSLKQRPGTEDIFVTTAVSADVLGVSFPPSQGQFAANVAQIMSNITLQLYRTGSPLLINVYPYFALVSEPQRISLDYALFQARSPVKDGQLEYNSLFDAMVDAFVAAMVRVVKSENVKVVISETGWPTLGRAPYASVENARIYNNRLREHARGVGRTPRKANINLQVYIRSMFNENLKKAGEEQNFGTFYPNFTQVYPLF